MQPGGAQFMSGRSGYESKTLLSFGLCCSLSHADGINLQHLKPSVEFNLV